MPVRIVSHEHIFRPRTHFQQCHASTILKTTDDTLLVSWFGGPHEGHPEVSIWISKRVSGVWSPPLKLVESNGLPCWNPVLSRNSDGRIFLYYKVGISPIVWSTWYVYSDNEGNSWSNPAELVKGNVGGRGPVKNKCILLSNGEMLAPASIETETDWDAFVDRSKDGLAFTESALVPLKRSQLAGKGIIQPSLWESTKNNVHMLLRSSEGLVFRSDSVDYGQTWCTAYPTELPNNNSGIDLVRTGDVLVLVHNPVNKNWGVRSPLVLSLSNDNGLSWHEELELDRNDQPADKHDGEFSYPAIIADESTLYLCYTWKRQTISFWQLELN